MEGHWKFLRGGGVLEAKFLETMYENKLEFPGGRGGAKQKTFRGRSMDILLELHNESVKHKLSVLELARGLDPWC